jgi:enoyl-CoA hydratase/carnithine racemase
MREPALGLVPDLTGTHPLVRLIGYSRALELCATTRWIEADEARLWGLVNVVDDELDSAVESLVEHLLSIPDAGTSGDQRSAAECAGTDSDGSACTRKGGSEPPAAAKFPNPGALGNRFAAVLVLARSPARGRLGGAAPH